MIRVVVFDLDDTLYPERSYALGGFRAVADRFSNLLGDRETAIADMVRLMDEGFRGRIFNELAARRGLAPSEEQIAAMVKTYRAHRPQIKFYADAEAALHRLKPLYPLGLITDGDRTQQWAKIDALGLRKHIEEIIVTSELTSEGDDAIGVDRPSYAKPHPFAFELMAKHFDVAPTECVYVADNLAKDFVAPNALGWMTVQVWRAGGIYLDAVMAEGGEADFRIQNLDKLDALLVHETSP